MVLALVAPSVIAAVLLLGAPVASGPPDGPRLGPAETGSAGTTVVSLTFDGTDQTHVAAARILAGAGMAGTFYVNAGEIGLPGHLDVDQLHAISQLGSEIAGASVHGRNLSDLAQRDARREVCDDRATLAGLGFTVTSFAYPYRFETAREERVARACGYNSARDSSGLYASPTACTSCPTSEAVPPEESYRIRTPGPITTLEDLTQRVQRSEAAGGGWLPLVFTRVCRCPAVEQGEVKPEVLAAFVSWLRDRPSSTRVRTIAQVIGGTVRPVSGTPVDLDTVAAQVDPDEDRALSQVPAWTVLGLGIDQARILFTGVLASLLIVLIYRRATRNNRYEG